MATTQNSGGSLILNEITMTLHKQELGLGEFQAACRQLDHVGQEKLRIIGVPDRIENHKISKCRQCFEQSGEY